LRCGFLHALRVMAGPGSEAPAALVVMSENYLADQ
jgi:hypothetical protein